jgi:hypothetical protein
MAASADLLVRIITDTSKATGLDDTGKKTSKFASGVAKASVVAGGALLALGAAGFKAASAAAEDAQSATLLANSLKNSTGATSDQIAATEDWIAKMALATGVADDQLRPALGTLVRATGDTAKSQDALSAALDISAATGKDLESVSAAIAKGYAGQTSSLGRLVPGIDKAVLASGDMEAIMAELAKTTKGAAAESADTAAGKMAIMKVSMDEATESIGTSLLPIMSKMATVLATVAQWIQKNSTLFLIIATIIGTVAAAIMVLNAIIAINTTITTIAGIAAQHAWLAALGPIGLVILAVAATVAIVIILWKKCETFRRIVTAAFNAVKSAATKTFNWIKRNWPLLLAILTGPIGLAVLAIAKNWTKIKTGATAVKDWIVLKFGQVWTYVSGVWTKIKTGATTVKDWVNKKFGDIWTSISGVFLKITTKFNDLVTFVKDLKIPNPLDGLITAFNTVIGLVDDLIAALKDIKVPKIKLPFGIGKTAPAGAAAVPMGLGAARGLSVPMLTTRAGHGTTININVTGALDPEATARQIQRILAGHVQRAGLRTA